MVAPLTLARIALAIALASAPAAACAQDLPGAIPPPPATATAAALIDVWLGDFIDGVKTGYVHVRAIPCDGPGGPGIELREDHYSRARDSITEKLHESRTTFLCVMEPDLRVRRVELTTVEFGERARATTTTAERAADRYVVRTALDGRVQEWSVPAQPPIIGSNDLLMQRLLAAGELADAAFETTFRELDFDRPRAIEKRLRVAGRQRVARGTGAVELTGVAFDDVLVWLAPDGTVDHGRIGGTEVRALAEAEAKRFGKDEIYTFQSKLSSAAPIPGVPAAEAVVVAFTVPGDPRGDVIRGSQYQEVLDVTRRADACVYTVKLLPTAPSATARERLLALRERAARAEELAEFLEPDPIRCADDPVVAAKAREIVAGAETARGAVVRLAGWIHDNLGKQYTAIGDLSARETLDRMEGDCSEHAILFDAFARSLGIPVRECAGVVFFGTQGGSHAWSQVFIDGEWVHVDCVANAIGSAPQYVLFERHDPGRPRDPTLPERRTIFATRAIATDVVAYVVAGRTWRRDDLERAARVEGGEYRNELIGIAFPVPPGFRVQPAWEPTRARLMAQSGARVDFELRPESATRVLDAWVRATGGRLKVQTDTLGGRRAFRVDIGAPLGAGGTVTEIVALDRGSLVLRATAPDPAGATAIEMVLAALAIADRAAPVAISSSGNGLSELR